MGKKWEKWEKKKILFLPTYSQHIYLTTLKVSARSENFFKCAKTVRFLADTTLYVFCISKKKENNNTFFPNVLERRENRVENSNYFFLLFLKPSLTLVQVWEG